MKSDPDAAIDRLLPATLAARDAAPDGGCLDAETLAAWADGALNASDRANAEAHAADCARCRSLLAAMVRTEPPATAAESPFRLRARWWLLATLPAAAALVVWFAVPRRVPIQQSESASAVDQVTPAVPPPARPAPSPDRSADARAKVQEEPAGQDAPARRRAAESDEKTATAARSRRRKRATPRRRPGLRRPLRSRPPLPTPICGASRDLPPSGCRRLRTRWTASSCRRIPRRGFVSCLAGECSVPRTAARPGARRMPEPPTPSPPAPRRRHQSAG
jgi:Putative zinc-finger